MVFISKLGLESVFVVKDIIFFYKDIGFGRLFRVLVLMFDFIFVVLGSWKCMYDDWIKMFYIRIKRLVKVFLGGYIILEWWVFFYMLVIFWLWMDNLDLKDFIVWYVCFEFFIWIVINVVFCKVL